MKKKLMMARILGLTFLCTQVFFQPAHSADFGEEDTLMVAHKGFGDYGHCPDGDASMLIMQTMAFYLKDYHKVKGQFYALFSTPAPTITAITEKTPCSNGHIFMYDLHCSPESALTKKIHIYDHHASLLGFDLNYGPFKDASKENVAKALPHISGTHVAALHFMILALKYYDPKDKHLVDSLARLKSNFSAKTHLDNTPNIFDFMHKLGGIIREDPNIADAEPIKKLLAPETLSVLQNIGMIDLYSISGGQNMPVFKKVPFTGKSIEQMAQEVMALLVHNNLGITKENIEMNVCESFFVNKQVFKRNADDAMLRTKELSEILECLSNVALDESAIAQLRLDLLRKYTLFTLPQSSLYRLLDEKHSLKLKGQTVRIVYMPFSPSQGVNEELLHHFIDSDETQNKLRDATRGGAARECELLVRDILESVTKKKPHQKVLAILKGVKGYSFRSFNFNMVEYNAEENKMVNNLEKMGVFGGGHPGAAGGGLQNPVLAEIEKDVFSVNA